MCTCANPDVMNVTDSPNLIRSEEIVTIYNGRKSLEDVQFPEMTLGFK